MGSFQTFSYLYFLFIFLYIVWFYVSLFTQMESCSMYLYETWFFILQDSHDPFYVYILALPPSLWLLCDIAWYEYTTGILTIPLCEGCYQLVTVTDNALVNLAG